MLSGNNVVLQRATDAKKKSEEAQIRERIQLAYHSALTKDITGENVELTMPTLQSELNNEFVGKTVTITPSADNKEWTIEVDGVEVTVTAGKDISQVARITIENGTAPYFPCTVFSQVDGTSLSSGLVITDAVDENENSTGNEYVWIEVPSTYVDASITTGPDYSSVTGVTDYTNIALALRNYCKKDKNGNNLIKDGTNSDNQQTTTYGNTDEWYNGCGIASSDEYTQLYNNMLKSIYENGEFWIGRYEAGMTGDTGRTDENASIDSIIPLSQKNLIPIFYVTCNQAQIISTRTEKKGIYNSSLMFGIQWDLVLRYLSNKGVSTSLINSDSSSWENYQNTTNAALKGGKYTQYMSSTYQMTFNTWNAYNVNLGDIVKSNILNNVNMPQSVLLTTGASDKFQQKNIYDLAGNIDELTLERSSDSNPCTSRGACYVASAPVSTRAYGQSTDNSNYYTGFRVSIY